MRLLGRTERAAVLQECGFPDDMLTDVAEYSAAATDDWSEPNSPAGLERAKSSPAWPASKLGGVEATEFLCRWFPDIRIAEASEPEAFAGDLDISFEAIHTEAGSIGVIRCSRRLLFEQLVRALSPRYRDIDLDLSIGALFIANAKCEADAGGGNQSWLGMPAQPRLKHPVILLSGGGYSGLAGSDVALSEPEWGERSLEIRLHHELTHFQLRAMRGRLALNLTEELIADAEALRQTGFGGNAKVLGQVLGLNGAATQARYLKYIPSEWLDHADCFHRLLSKACEGASSRYWIEIPSKRRLSILGRMTLEDFAGDGLEVRLQKAVEKVEQ